MKSGATNFPNLRIIFCLGKAIEKNFHPVSSFHRFTNSQLKGIFKAVDRSNYTTEEVNHVVQEKVNWFLAIRKFWKLLVKFLTGEEIVVRSLKGKF